MMVIQVDFDKNEVNNAEAEFSKIVLEDRTRRIIELLVGLMGPQLPVSQMAMRGFVWRAIKHWQIKEKKLIADVRTFPTEQRLKAVRQIFDETITTFKNLVKTEAEKKDVEKVFEDAYKQYLKFA